MNLKRILLTTLLLLSFSLHAYSSDFHDARVKDISDRKYEEAVIELLDGAGEEIVISMYMVNPEKKPVAYLLKDLEEALDRGVSVEMYLNTRRRSKEKPAGEGEAFDSLRQKGAKIYTVGSSRRLHDKLIVVDRRYVVDGSTNWTVSAIKSNLESAVLIDSSEIAKEKLVRIRQILLENEKRKSAKKPEKLAALPKGETVLLSKDLLEDKKLFPSMVDRRDSRSMDAYLLLIAEAKKRGAREFFVSPENLAVTLGMPFEWSAGTLRGNVVVTLKRLKDRYKLINVNFTHSKDAWIELREMTGEAFKVNAEFFNPEYLTPRVPSVKFIDLIKTLLKSEGTTIDSFSHSALSRRFHISRATFRRSLND